MSVTPIIQLNQVTKRYNGLTAVNHVSLTVDRGELLVLVGSSGCGKTTTLRLVAGLERPDKGSVLLDGQQVAGQNAWIPPEQRRIGMVFQDYALFPHLTVTQNIKFAIQERSKAKRVEELLELVGLDGLGKRYPHQLSGGQQQRVALARALAPDPSVVLLDEPFSNLDAALRKSMRAEVRRILQAAQTTAIFVTHDQEEAMSLADSIAVMQSGQILQVGAPSEVYRYPNSIDVATFLGEANLLPGIIQNQQVATVLGVLPLVNTYQPGSTTVMIRPESLKLTPSAEGQGIVIDRAYYGTHHMLTIKVKDDHIMTRIWSQEQFAIGERVNIAVQGDVVAFQPTETPITSS